MILKPYSFFLLLIALVTIYSCEERTDGCLDKLATNYDVTADDPCENCCTNQKLDISFSFVNDTLSFLPGRSVEFRPGDSIIVENLVLGLSGFKLIDGSGDSLAALNRLNNNALDLPDNFVLLEGRSRSADVLEFRYEGQLSELQFMPGVPENVDDPDVAFSDTGFTELRDSLFSEDLNGYLKLKMEYIDLDSTPYYIELEDINDRTLSFALDTVLVRGNSYDGLSIEFDVAKFWNGVDLFDDPDDIRALLEQQLYESFILN